MQLTAERRAATGAFYTPELWARRAVEYLEQTLPEPLERFAFYDPAGGEGALLEALPEGCARYATSLEQEDVDIMRAKGIKAWQFDFLNNHTTLICAPPASKASRGHFGGGGRARSREGYRRNFRSSSLLAEGGG